MSGSSKPWHYADNQFLNATRQRNFKKMFLLTDNHYSSLVELGAGDPDIDAMRLVYLPFHQSYNSIYTHWKGAGDDHEGTTVDIKGLFEQLNDLLPVWEGQVYSVYAENTGTGHSIFPDKRKPFQAGAYASRIEAILRLHEKLITFPGDPVLVALAPNVLSFHNQIAAARIGQQGDAASEKAYSNLLEEQRILCAQQMYNTLGKLMSKYHVNPQYIEQFWNMSLLRRLDEEDFEWTMNVAAGANVVPLPQDIVEEMDADTEIELQNMSPDNVPWRAGFSATNNAEGPITKEFDEHVTRKEHAADLGWAPGRNFLILFNPGAMTGIARILVRR